MTPRLRYIIATTSSSSPQHVGPSNWTVPTSHLSCELESKLLVAPFVAPTVVPPIIPFQDPKP